MRASVGRDWPKKVSICCNFDDNNIDAVDKIVNILCKAIEPVYEELRCSWDVFISNMIARFFTGLQKNLEITCVKLLGGIFMGKELMIMMIIKKRN